MIKIKYCQSMQYDHYDVIIPVPLRVLLRDGHVKGKAVVDLTQLYRQSDIFL